MNLLLHVPTDHLGMVRRATPPKIPIKGRFSSDRGEGCGRRNGITIEQPKATLTLADALPISPMSPEPLQKNALSTLLHRSQCLARVFAPFRKPENFMSYDFYSSALTQTGLSSLPPQVAYAGWHTPSQIHTFAGLGGTYNWTEIPNTTMVFVPNAGVIPPPGMGFTPGGGGFYTLTSSGLSFTGQYYTRLSTSGFPPAIRLSGSGGRQYDVQGMFTSPGDTVSYMLMRSPTGMFFLPYRIS